MATFLTPVVAPTGLGANAGDGQNTLAWNASASANSYQVYRSVTNGGPYLLVATVAETNYTDVGLSNGINYFYLVKAAYAVSQSVASTQIFARPVSSMPPQCAVILGGGNLHFVVAVRPHRMAFASADQQFECRAWQALGGCGKFKKFEPNNHSGKFH